MPEGKFFFGFKYTPFDPTKVKKKEEEKEEKLADPFGGEGNSLKRRRGDVGNANASANTAKAASPVKEEKEDPWAKLGSGNALAPKKKQPVSAPAQAPSQADIIDATQMDEDDFNGQWEEDDEDDGVIEMDSD